MKKLVIFDADGTLTPVRAAGVPPYETLFVGDQETDRQAAEAAGVEFIWAKGFFA